MVVTDSRVAVGLAALVAMLGGGCAEAPSDSSGGPLGGGPGSPITATAGNSGASGATAGSAGMGAAGVNSAGSSGIGSAGSGPMPAAGTGAAGAAGMAGGSAGGAGCSGDACGADECPMDPMKEAPGECGCGMPDTDADANGTPDCMDDEPVDPDACAVATIPDDLRQDYDFDPFYTRYASAAGVPIVSSDSPDDEAIRRACMIVLDLSSGPANVRPSMLENQIYFIMMGADEQTVDTPEFRPAMIPDSRARGLGSTNYAVCAEESVMCDRSDRWYGESICVHEYSHTFHHGVYNRVDPMFDSKVRAAYDNARSNGLWSNTYADDSAGEYFAEGVQSWYNTNQQARRSPSDGVHNAINTKDELEEYDPMLYEVLAEVLPAEPMWTDCYHYDM